MLETLNRDAATLTPLFEALQTESSPVHRVVVHRPGSPRPVLRPAPALARPTVLPPSERGLGRSVSRSGQASSASRLRLTRRGRLTLLLVAITLLFTAFSIGRVLSNASTSAPTGPATHTVVVAPGDTAWSIAHVAMPHLDGRDAVDRLLAMNHSDGQIQIGETLTVPGS